jgi:hypothetical protein
MKKLVLSIVCAGLAFGAMAQGGADKKVQAGISYQFGLNYNKPGTKVIERDGVGVANSIGLTLNFALTPNIAVATGLEFDFESFKYDVTSASPIFYNYIDTKILQKQDGTAGATMYQLSNRKQKAIYGTIPTMLLFRTNPIGDFRYFGKFGARTSFLLGNTIFDQGFNVVNYGMINETRTAQENTEMRAAGDMFFVRSTMGISGGAEWNFTGSTSMYAEIGFHYGFTPIHNIGSNMDRMTLYKFGTAGSEEYLRFSAKQKQILLKIGILF